MATHAHVPVMCMCKVPEKEERMRATEVMSY